MARMHAGQAVVQFARNVLDQREYALKVFAVAHAFEAEAAMYNDETISSFLPRVEAMHDGTDASVADPKGRPLCPCIVMEKGESLNEWSARAEPDLFMSIAVRCGSLVTLRRL
jgi:ABC-type Zn uptake system ZnuABC Zn-binding protein ZnuA